jgi:iron(III) transport system permease protein
VTVRGRAPLTAVAAVVVGLALLPLAYLVIRGAGAEDPIGLVASGRVAALVGRTVLLVACTTALATVLGAGLAFLVVRTDLPGRRVWGVLAALPLVVPSYVLALAFIAAIGPGGLLGARWSGALFGLPGATLALALATYPYVFLLTVAALRRLDPALEEAARSLGRSRAQAFRSVVLPVLRPSIGAGALLVALYALSDFGVVSLMRFDALTRAIYTQYRALFDREPAAVLGLVLVLLTAVVLVLEARSRVRGRVVRSGPVRVAAPVPLGRWKVPALLACAVVVGVALVLPVGVLLWWALRAPADVELVAPAVRTVGVGLLAAAAAAVAALPVAALAVRFPSRLSALLERGAYAANALPGIVIALALVFFGTRLAGPLYQTLALLVFAYCVRFLPQALAGAHGAFLRLDPRLDEAARGLGAGRLRRLRTVSLPLLAPGVLAGATLVFLSTVKELPATLLLRPIGFDTLATEVWSATSVSAYGEAAPPALLLLLLAAPVVYALQLRGSREAEELRDVPGPAG